MHPSQPGGQPDVVLELRDVSKHFAGKYAVRDVSFAVRRGEIFGFLGPNGAGKSTTIRMILDVLRPTGGAISILGHDSRDVRQVHRQIGYLSGDMVMDSSLTGGQYLQFAAAQYGRDCRQQVDALRQQLQADLSIKIGNYSRGNRQKIGLIAALMHEPQLLILDEPTSGFDPLIQEQFVALIRRFRDSGRTVFMSSHILNEVQELCDRVAFIRDGQLVDTTAIAQLTASAAKRVNVRLPVAQLGSLRKRVAALDGVRMGQAAEQYAVQFSYAGDPNALLRLLADFTVDEVTIQQPELDEVFMHYYDTTGRERAASKGAGQ